MAKDPAFLWYPGDYLSGTMHLDFETKGAYVELLMLQFNKDHMTLHMIQHILGHKFDHIWSLISDKFLEKDGFYWNERLRIEKEKRVRFCKSRRDNKNKDQAEGAHMLLHMENENTISRVLYSKSKKSKNQKALRGSNFDETKENVFFDDGTYQPLGRCQKDLLQIEQLKPTDIVQGLIN